MKTLGNYRIDGLLGEGGMGAVYRAHDLSLQRDVAIKLIHEQYARQPVFRERFIQEARVMASLNHPGIVKVYHLGVEGDLLYIPMEFIAGGNLRQLLDDLLGRKQWLPLPEAVRLVAQLCQIVEYAHQRKVLHRDIKPANLMIKPEPSAGLPYQVILTDLGLAKILEGQGLTHSGTTVGTPAYMSPEQASGRDTDPRSDVYSLGILLYELAVGRLPFPIRSITEAMRYHTQEAPPKPRSIRPDLPEALERLILKALAKEPGERYASAANFGSILAGTLEASLDALQKAEQVGSSLVTAYDKSIVSGLQASVLDAPGLGAAGAARSRTVVEAEQRPATRGSSIFAGQSISPSSQSRIQVVHKEHTAEIFPLPLGTVTIGRATENDIRLSDPKASQRHAQVSWDGREYKVLDVGSTNGTHLGSARLLPGMPEIWRPHLNLRIGDTWLRLLDPMMEPARVVSPPGRSGSYVAFSKSSAGVVEAALNPPQLAVEAGGSASATLSLINQSPQVDHFSITVAGLPPNCTVTLPAQVELMPGAPQDIGFVMQVPRAPQSRAGRQLLTFRISSQREPGQFVEVKAALTIAPYSQYRAELRPQRIRAGQVGRLNLSNQGNLQEVLTVDFSDDFEELDFQPRQQQVRLPEGQSATVEYRAQPRQRRWIGGSKSHSFQARINIPKGEPQILRAELLSQAFLPTWVPAAVLPVCVLLAVGLMALLASLFRGPSSAAPGLAPGTLTQSVTPPPGAPTVEEWCIYLKEQPPASFQQCPVQVSAAPGQTLVVHWRVSNAVQVTVEPLGPQQAAGDSELIVPSELSSITLRALSAENQEVSKATQIIQVNLAAPTQAPIQLPTSTIALPPTATLGLTGIPTLTPVPSATVTLTEPSKTFTPTTPPTATITAFSLDPCFACFITLRPPVIIIPTLRLAP